MHFSLDLIRKITLSPRSAIPPNKKNRWVSARKSAEIPSAPTITPAKGKLQGQATPSKPSAPASAPLKPNPMLLILSLTIATDWPGFVFILFHSTLSGAEGMPGKFIVFEGLDGSGKGTMLTKTAEWLFNQSVDHDKIVLTREPTFSGTGKQIRKMLKSDKEPLTKAKRLLQLYLEDRKEHLDKVIKPAMQHDSIVLCDRYKYSTICYQQAQGIEVNKIISLHKRMLVPDLVLILDVDSKAALKRIHSSRSRIEKFEKAFFLDELRCNYLALKKLLPKENIKVIDADCSIEESFAKVKREISKVLK